MFDIIRSAIHSLKLQIISRITNGNEKCYNGIGISISIYFTILFFFFQGFRYFVFAFGPSLWSFFATDITKNTEGGRNDGT